MRGTPGTMYSPSIFLFLYRVNSSGRRYIRNFSFAPLTPFENDSAVPRFHIKRMSLSSFKPFLSLQKEKNRDETKARYTTAGSPRTFIYRLGLNLPKSRGNNLAVTTDKPFLVCSQDSHAKVLGDEAPVFQQRKAPRERRKLPTRRLKLIGRSTAFFLIYFLCVW